MPSVRAFVDKLPARADSGAPPPAPAWRDTAGLLMPQVDEAFAMTTQVNYVAAATQLYAEGEKVDGAPTPTPNPNPSPCL